MRDHLLFAVFPYVAGLAFVLGCAVQLARWRHVDRNDVPAASSGAFSHAWHLAFAVVAIGHVLTLAFPVAVVGWDRQFFRLILLEGTQIVAGGLVVAGAITALARLVGPSPLRLAWLAQRKGTTRSAIDVVAATLLVTVTISGLAIATLYRWGSAWSAVTLAPYLSSLARFDPSTELVTHLPVLVKLHVVSAIVLVTTLPFTSPARALLMRLTFRAHPRYEQI